jgi:hypothetical protein
LRSCSEETFLILLLDETEKSDLCVRVRVRGARSACSLDRVLASRNNEKADPREGSGDGTADEKVRSRSESVPLVEAGGAGRLWVGGAVVGWPTLGGTGLERVLLPRAGGEEGNEGGLEEEELRNEGDFWYESRRKGGEGRGVESVMPLARILGGNLGETSG